MATYELTEREEMKRGLEQMSKHGGLHFKRGRQQRVTRIWETFVEQSPEFKKLILNRILDHADNEHHRKLEEMDLTHQQLVERLSHPANQEYARQVFTHPAWIEAAQNVQSAYVRTKPKYFLKNALDNKSPKLSNLLGASLNDSPGTVLVNGFIDSLVQHAETHGIPEEIPATPVRRPPGTTVHGAGTRRLTPGRRGVPPATPGTSTVPPGVEEFIASHYIEPTIDVFDAVKHGIKHDSTLHKYVASKVKGIDHDVATLMHDAEGFISHMTAHSVNVEKEGDLDHFVHAALSEPDFHHRKETKELDPRGVSDLRETIYDKVLPHTSGKASPAILEEYLLPEKHAMFDKKEKEILAHEVNIDNYRSMRTGLGRVNLEAPTELQKQFAAFHVLTKLLQRADHDKAGNRLKEFVRKIGQDQTAFHRDLAGLKGKRRLDQHALFAGLEALIPPAEEEEAE